NKSVMNSGSSSVSLKWSASWVASISAHWPSFLRASDREAGRAKPASLGRRASGRNKGLGSVGIGVIPWEKKSSKDYRQPSLHSKVGKVAATHKGGRLVSVEPACSQLRAMCPERA